MEIVIPPLRERREDIATLTVAFVDYVCRQFDKTLARVAQELITVFVHYPWPGNVRQLRRKVERAVALISDGEPLAPDRCSPEVTLGASDYDLDTADGLSLPSRVREFEMKVIRAARKRTAGGKGKAAEVLGITRQGLHKKLKRYAID